MTGRLRRVLPDRGRIELDDGTDLDYDALLVAVGARRVPAYEHGLSFDRGATPEEFDDALRDTGSGLATSVAVVVPPETAWALPAYELALLLHAHRRMVTVTVVTHERRPLDAFGRDASRRVAETLSSSGITWRAGHVADVATDTAFLAGGAWLQADRIVHLPVPVGPHVHGLPEHDGFVAVGPSGRVPVAAGRVWAAGDGTAAGWGSGAVAAQLAARAVGDIVLELFGESLPQAPPLAVCGLLPTPAGPLYLRADVDDPDGSSTWSTTPLWWPPSKVAAPWLTSALRTRPAPGPALARGVQVPAAMPGSAGTEADGPGPSA